MIKARIYDVCNALTNAGRIVIGLYGQVVPKTVGMYVFDFTIQFFSLLLSFFKYTNGEYTHL